MITTYKAAPDIDVLTSNFPIPGFGLVPINAFVLHGPEPILVDTGTVIDSDEFMATLRSVIDPADLEWIWLTTPTSIMSARWRDSWPTTRSSGSSGPSSPRS
jgi:hypothetical protein